MISLQIHKFPHFFVAKNALISSDNSFYKLKQSKRPDTCNSTLYFADWKKIPSYNDRKSLDDFNQYMDYYSYWWPRKSYWTMWI